MAASECGAVLPCRLSKASQSCRGSIFAFRGEAAALAGGRIGRLLAKAGATLKSVCLVEGTNNLLGHIATARRVVIKGLCGQPRCDK